MRITKFVLSDAVRTNRSITTTPHILKNFPIVEKEEPISLDTLRESSKRYKSLALYEDQKRLQPKDIVIEEMNNQSQKPDIVVTVRRSDSKPYGNRYPGFKPKGEIGWKSFDRGNYTKQKSEILLCGE